MVQRDQFGHPVQDPAEFVARLRAEFTTWAVLHDPFAGEWVALHHGVTLRACSGIALREQILTAARRWMP